MLLPSWMNRAVTVDLLAAGRAYAVVAAGQLDGPDRPVRPAEVRLAIENRDADDPAEVEVLHYLDQQATRRGKLSFLQDKAPVNQGLAAASAAARYRIHWTKNQPSSAG
jgi:hypothetical protein